MKYSRLPSGLNTGCGWAGGHDAAPRELSNLCTNVVGRLPGETSALILT